jgi:hypothetical protein
MSTGAGWNGFSPMSADTIKGYFCSIRTELALAEEILNGGDDMARKTLVASINNMELRNSFERILSLCSAISGAEAGTVIQGPGGLRPPALELRDFMIQQCQDEQRNP